jgi:hypothetical protein
MPGRLQVLQFLRDSERRMREIAAQHPSAITPDLLRIANEIAADSAKLEAELIEAGLIAKRNANEN